MSGMGSPCVRYVVEKEIKKALKRMIEKYTIKQKQVHKIFIYVVDSAINNSRAD